jgi:hypothetical protein
MSLRPRWLFLVGSIAALAVAFVLVWLSSSPERLSRVDPIQGTSPSPRRSEPLQTPGELVERLQVEPPKRSLAEDAPRVLASGPLEGQVVDFMGAPLAGVQVALQCEEGSRFERSSDAEGRFRIESLASSKRWRVSAELAPAWRLWSIEGFRPNAEGGWEPLLIRMIGVGALEVAVEDRLGQPLEGVAIAVQPDNMAPLSPSQFTPAQPDASPARVASAPDAFPKELAPQITDPKGVARFEGVWAERRLIVSIVTGIRRRWGVRQAGGRLVLEDEEPIGEVISIPVGGRLALRARPIELQRSLSGRVSFPDGRPVSRPSIFLRSIDPQGGRIFRSYARGREDGGYSVALDELREGATLRVRATDGSSSDQHQGKHSGGVELAIAGSDLHADVVVEPMLTISGRIERAGLPPAPGTLRILPQEPAHPAAPDDLGYQPVNPDGSFEVSSLARGSYLLEFTERWFLADAHHTFPHVQAGTTEFIWSLPERSAAHIAFCFRAPRPVVEFSLLVAQPQAVLGANPEWQQAPASWRVSRFGWPRWMGLGRSTGAGAMEIEGSTFHYRVHDFGVQGDPARRNLDLPPDVYVLGALAFDAQGRTFAPVMSAPARLMDGDYEITFELAESASVVGRVEGAQPELGLEVAALDEAGGLIPLIQDRRGEFLPLAADGGFRLVCLPVGTVLLRVGTPFDLKRGVFGAEQRLQLAAGETAEVTLHW